MPAPCASKSICGRKGANATCSFPCACSIAAKAARKRGLFRSPNSTAWDRENRVVGGSSSLAGSPARPAEPAREGSWDRLPGSGKQSESWRAGGVSPPLEPSAIDCSNGGLTPPARPAGSEHGLQIDEQPADKPTHAASQKQATADGRTEALHARNRPSCRRLPFAIRGSFSLESAVDPNSRGRWSIPNNRHKLPMLVRTAGNLPDVIWRAGSVSDRRKLAG